MVPIPGRNSLILDTAHLSPQDAAMRIISHYDLLEGAFDEAGLATPP
jgi:hypothetical protein